MNQDTIEKLEEYRDNLKHLKNFEESLEDSNYDRLAIEAWSYTLKDWIGCSICISKEPVIKEKLLEIIKERIEYYNKKIEEL